MRQVIEHLKILNNKNFVGWFLMTNFPEGIDTSKDCSMAELMDKNYELDREWVDDFTGYYEGVFDENDGYIKNPKTIELRLATRDKLYVEFHPGDTIYYINDNVIGCTGPDYSIRKISMVQFGEYTKNMEDAEKIFLLPMLRGRAVEREDLLDLIKSVLSGLDLQECSISDLCECILENCSE